MRLTREKEDNNRHITKDGMLFYSANKKYKWVRGKKKYIKEIKDDIQN